MSDYDVFICYRRAGGEALSQLLYERLTRDGYRVFYDVETMRSGKFNEQILQNISESKAVLVILPPHALDRCMEGDDWVRQEIAHALEQKKLLIPILMRGFTWPNELPADIRELPDYQGVAANDFSVFDTWYERMKSYINEAVGRTPTAEPGTGRSDPQAVEDQIAYVRFCLEIGTFEEADAALAEMLQAAPKNAELWLLQAMAREKVSQEEGLTQSRHPLEENRAFMQAVRYGDAALQERLKGYVLTVRNALSKQSPKPAAVKVAAAATVRRMLLTGGYMKLGCYPQTHLVNVMNPIEWLVLDVQKNKALLISRYGLDAQPYNTNDECITWGKCSLRTWLNSTFMNKAFTAQEQSGILLTYVDNGSSQGYSEFRTSGGSDTQDRVFLLSCAEVNKYFGELHYLMPGSDKKAVTSPTAYAQHGGALARADCKTADGAHAGWWWLRSPGWDQNVAASVSADGSLIDSRVNDGSGCVRPALWINLEADIF